MIRLRSAVLRVPRPPSVASALSGFVVGVLVTMVATGVLGNGGGGSSSNPPATLPAATGVASPTMKVKLSRIAIRELGLGYPNPKVPRLIQLLTVPARPLLIQPDQTQSLESYRSVDIVFRLNDHPFGRAWRLRAAKRDVFALMKALYTSDQPVYNVELDGRFPIRVGKVTREQTVMIAFIDHQKASTIPWKRWGRDHEQQLWSLLTIKAVDPAFA